jgi:hypothetical protein
MCLCRLTVSRKLYGSIEKEYLTEFTVYKNYTLYFLLCTAKCLQCFLYVYYIYFLGNVKK